MKLLYGTASDGVCLRRCFGLDGEVRLPDQVEGIPVTRLGPYLFSDGMERAGILKRMKAPLFLWEEGRGSLPVREPLGGQDLLEWEGLPAASGPALTSLSLPSEIRQVGAYSLYGCSSLKRLEFSLSISDWGAGVFSYRGQRCSGDRFPPRSGGGLFLPLAQLFSFQSAQLPYGGGRPL